MVGRFEDIANTLENGEATPENVEISLVTLDSVKNYTIAEGTTVAEFKRNNGITPKAKLSDEDGNLLRDTDTFEFDMEVFVSSAKENGKIFIRVIKA